MPSRPVDGLAKLEVMVAPGADTRSGKWRACTALSAEENFRVVVQDARPEFLNVSHDARIVVARGNHSRHMFHVSEALEIVLTCQGLAPGHWSHFSIRDWKVIDYDILGLRWQMVSAGLQRRVTSAESGH
jgi:hypothetical protein